jgi:hypothetical protein
VPGTHPDSEQRLSLILGTQQAIAAAGDDLESVMQIVAERSMAILGADGSMVNLVDGDMLHTRAAGGHRHPGPRRAAADRQVDRALCDQERRAAAGGGHAYRFAHQPGDAREGR